MKKAKQNFTSGFLFKCIMLAALALLLLIPQHMISSLIEERQQRSDDAIQRITAKWSTAQTICAPLIVIPYHTEEKLNDNSTTVVKHTLFLTPQDLNIDVSLTPQERHYGIYKATLYGSSVHISGKFAPIIQHNTIEPAHKQSDRQLLFDDAQLAISVTDMHGVIETPVCNIGGKNCTMSVMPLFLGEQRYTSKNPQECMVPQNALVVDLTNDDLTKEITFDCTLQLNGSSAMHFIPVGEHTAVAVNGTWPSPSFVGSFSPQSNIQNNHFTATWSVLSFNRNIPSSWSDDEEIELSQNSFGVNLISMLDMYQQNMRTIKYAFMFIALTFIAFFFVELYTKKSIHYFQYVLVGVALILFYSLLLSLSEQIGFGWSYLIAAIATTTMIIVYFHSIIRQRNSTILLTGILIGLYTFLYILLQIEDYALLIGSIFLFVILGIIMYFSNRIHFNHSEEPDPLTQPNEPDKPQPIQPQHPYQPNKYPQTTTMKQEAKQQETPTSTTDNVYEGMQPEEILAHTNFPDDYDAFDDGDVDIIP